MGMRLMGMHLIDMHLIDMHLMGTHLVSSNHLHDHKKLTCLRQYLSTTAIPLRVFGL